MDDINLLLNKIKKNKTTPLVQPNTSSVTPDQHTNNNTPQVNTHQVNTPTIFNNKVFF